MMILTSSTLKRYVKTKNKIPATINEMTVRKTNVAALIKLIIHQAVPTQRTDMKDILNKVSKILLPSSLPTFLRKYIVSMAILNIPENEVAKANPW